MRREGLDEAINRAGTARALAAALGLSPQTIGMWKLRGNVPAEYCPAIEGATGVRCESIRPDVPWDVLRGTAKAAQVAKSGA